MVLVIRKKAKHLFLDFIAVSYTITRKSTDKVSTKTITCRSRWSPKTAKTPEWFSYI